MSKTKRAHGKPAEERETLTSAQKAELDAFCDRALAAAVLDRISHTAEYDNNTGAQLGATRLCSARKFARAIDFTQDVQGVSPDDVSAFWQKTMLGIQRQQPDAIVYIQGVDGHNGVVEIRTFGDRTSTTTRLVRLYRQDGTPNIKRSPTDPIEVRPIALATVLAGMDTASRERVLAVIRTLHAAWIPPSRRPADLDMADVPNYVQSTPLTQPSACVRPAWDLYRTFRKQAQQPGPAALAAFDVAIAAHEKVYRADHPEMPPGALRDVLLDRTATLACWAANSFPVYNLTPAFTASLVLTDPLSLPASALRFPHTSFCARFPGGFLGSYGGVANPEIVWLTLCRASTRSVQEIQDPANDPLTPPASSSSHDWLAGLADPQYADALWSTASWLIVQVAGKRANSTDVSAGAIFLVGTGDTPKALGKELQDRYLVNPGLQEGILRRTFEFLRLAINVGLYAAEKQAERAEARPESEKPREPRKPSPKRNAAGDPIPDVIVLDQTVKLDAETIELARRIARGEQKRAATYKLHGRIYVSGHYRHNQVCGSRKKLPDGRWTPWPSRRSVWIAPYTKNPEGDTITRHIYELGKPASAKDDASTGGSGAEPQGEQP